MARERGGRRGRGRWGEREVWDAVLWQEAGGWVGTAAVIPLLLYSFFPFGASVIVLSLMAVVTGKSGGVGGYWRG